MPKPTQISSASFWNGLQNIGQTSGQAHITGTLNASPSGVSSTSSNLTGTIFVSLPDPTVVSLFRVNIPEYSNIANTWIPLFGTAVIWNTASPYNYKLILYSAAAGGGRYIYFNFVNAQNSISSIDIHLNIYAHLYTYPW